MMNKGKDPMSFSNRAMCMMNDEFGVTGWSHSVTYESIDYIDNENGYEVGVGALVKVTLKDGSFHEDVGYGVARDQKFKGHCIARARKLASNDAFINSVRAFGNQFQEAFLPGKIRSYFSAEKIDMNNTISPTSVKRKLDLTSSGSPSNNKTSASNGIGQAVLLNDKAQSSSSVTSVSNKQRQDSQLNSHVYSAASDMINLSMLDDSYPTSEDLVFVPNPTLSQARESPDTNKRRRKIRQLQLEIEAREKLKNELSMQENPVKGQETNF